MTRKPRIRVKVLVPHDHLRRYQIVDLVHTPDVVRRIERGYLIETETKDEGKQENE